MIAWGFPYLWDPVGDAAWTAQILDWRAPDGQQVDGYSADIEEATEGVMLSAQRAAVYLELVRQVAGSRLVVATVYPPIRQLGGGVPVPGNGTLRRRFRSDGVLGVHRSRHRRRARRRSPLDTPTGARHRTGLQLGQCWRPDRLPERSRDRRVLSAGRRAGALGASFWVWQEATPEEWGRPWAATAGFVRVSA